MNRKLAELTREELAQISGGNDVCVSPEAPEHFNMFRTASRLCIENIHNEAPKKCEQDPLHAPKKCIFCD